MESALHLAADHPAYAGHFPGHPILPGVVLLAEALHAIAAATGRPIEQWSLAGVKFLQPVSPGEALVLDHSATGRGGVRFEVRANARVVASGTLVARA